MISQILVAVDGSSHADRAIDFAAEMAASFDARLTIVNVVPYVSTVPLALGSYAELEGLYADSRDVLEDAGDQIVAAAADRARKAGATNIETRVEFGSPAGAVCDAAEAIEADVVVMGRRGLGDFGGLFLGSVTHKVAHNADCTVVTVK